MRKTGRDAPRLLIGLGRPAREQRLQIPQAFFQAGDTFVLPDDTLVLPVDAFAWALDPGLLLDDEFVQPLNRGRGHAVGGVLNP